MQADTGNEVAETIAYDSAGMMTGKPEPQMQFPTGTEFSPYAVIANRTDRTISVAASAAFQQGTSPIELALPSIRLAPRSTVKANIASALKAAGVTPEKYINLRFSFTGRHGDILLVAGSVDQTNDFVFEVPSAIEVKSNSRIICYWQVFNDTSSMISLWNYSKADEDFSLTLSFAGGSYRLPVSLAAGESRTIDVGKLIHQQTPDALGKTIPVSVTQGSALLSGPRSEADLMEVASSASIFNVRTATCGVVCTSCNGASGGFLDQAPFPLKVGSSAQGNAKVQFQTGSTQSWPSGSWTSANTGVAATSASGMIQGMSGGSATLNFTITGLNGYTGAGEACNNGMSICPPIANPFYGQGSATVNQLKCTSGILRGATTTCTITGSGGVTAWTFTDLNGNTVARSSNPTSTTWSGAVVTSGSVSVTAGGMPLSAIVVVAPRPNFAFSPVQPVRQSQGYNCMGGSTPNPPKPPPARLGLSCLVPSYGAFQFQPITDGGPNNGYTFTFSITDATTYNWTMAQDINTPASVFYKAQCGNYNSTTNQGFVSGPTLDADLQRHEAGSTASHYQNYVSALANPNNNLGVQAEKLVVLAGQDYKSTLASIANPISASLQSMASVEPCGTSVASYNSSCKFDGNINYDLPYAACQ